ncbi:MAG: phenylalanine--tRNA ligase subunit alpha [Candidatus Micrarchaeota archaeon]|nr:phenylalanine--tRNA ligase subunit alpha [Candidatus Micrarchaeota archaeon]MCX8154256.1 phenylalanine--tRNA ligase subunit alpha [Candidatus Micrarchaeota archaeon]
MINKAERDFLDRLRDGEWHQDSSIHSNLDFVRRTGYFLSTKGMVEMKVESRVVERLNDRARDILDKFRMLKDGTSIQEIPTYMIGILKDLGMIDGRTFRRKEVDMERYLRDRGYIDKYEEKTYYYRITHMGREALDRWKDTEYVINIDSVRSGNIDIPYIQPNNIPSYRRAKPHIITVWKRKISKIFYEFGFREMKGDYIQLSLWNFDMLFQPQDHPSRELADTFYLNRDRYLDVDTENVRRIHERYWKYEWEEREAKKLVLRTHTTALSALTLYSNREGKYFSVGKVFRNEAVDYKHLAEFHQIEGIIAHRTVNFGTLMGFLREFYSRLGLNRIRFRPSYFPYTEPSLEIEAYFPNRSSWIEVGGAGIFREQVSKMLGAVYPVAAFGLSLERTIMLFENIDDIRKLYD